MAYGGWSSQRWKNTWSNGYYAVDVLWQYRQDIDNNKTQISVNALRIRSLNSYYSFRYTASICGIGGFNGAKNEYTRDISVSGGGSTTIDLPDHAAEIGHNADGSWRNGTYYGWYKFNAVLTGNHAPNTNWGSFGVDGEIPKIPRATNPSINSSSIELGKTLTINMPRASTGFTHKLSYSINGESGEIASDLGTSYEWLIPTSFADLMPNSTTGLCTISCETYSGNTHIGTKTINATFLVPESYVPSVSSVSISEATPGLLSKFGVYVQSKSTLRIQTGAVGSHGSTVDSITVSVDGITYKSNIVETSTINQSGNIPVDIEIMDSRGRKATKKEIINVIPYEPPTISLANVTRANSGGVAHEEGIYALCGYSYSISEVNKKNNPVFKIQYLNGTLWEDLITFTDYKKSGEYISTKTFSVNEPFKFRFYISDYFGSSSVEKTIDISYSLINFGANGHSFALGVHSSNKGEFENSLPTKFYGDFHLAGSKFSMTLAIQKIIGKLMNPVGTVVINTTGINPGEYLGGTWEPFAQGRTLIGAGTGNDGSTSMSFTSLSEGGSYNHQLTVEEMPKHKHKMILRLNASVGQHWARPPLTANAGSNLEHDDPVQFSGGNQPHNNIQPYIVVFYWIRVQ